jgi:hypothetical protein
MSVQKILSEAINKNPSGLKEELVSVLDDKVNTVVESMVSSMSEAKLDEMLRKISNRSFSKNAHVVGGIGDEKEGESYVSMKDTRTGARYKVKSSEVGNVPYIEEVEYIDEVLDTPKSKDTYIGKAIDSAKSAISSGNKLKLTKREKGLSLAYDADIRKAVKGGNKFRSDISGKMNQHEEVELGEEVLKYGKEYVDGKINSGEWKFLQGARKPGGVFTVKDLAKNQVMAIMYDIKK